MDILQKHELFEIETLANLKNAGLLEPLVFGGGTMLRLCFNLNRYSTDLDFWFIKAIEQDKFFAKLKSALAKNYELTDAHIKFYTILLELRSADYPKKLKIEIRKGVKKCDFQEQIAFSRGGTQQVILKCHTLEQTTKNKIEAALERQDIRDFFDIEFLLRNGVTLKADKTALVKLKELAGKFKERDYKVALGSLLDKKPRDYYVANGFDYLIRKINV